MALFGKSAAKKTNEEVETSFILTFDIEGEEPFEIDVTDKVVVGSSEKASVCIENHDLAPKHYVFKQQEDMLTLNYLGPDAQSKIGKQKLNYSKMYILEDGDQLTCDGVTIVVDKVQVSIESADDEDSEFAENTMISSNKSALEELDKEPEVPDDFDEVTVARLISSQTDETARPPAQKLKSPPPARPKEAQEEAEVSDEPPQKTPAPTPNRTPRTRTALPAAKPRPAHKVIPGLRANPPGFFARVFSLALSCAFIYTLFKNAPQEQVAEWQKKSIDLISPIVEKWGPQIPYEFIKPLLDPQLLGLALFFLILWALLELVQAVLFGGPLGLLIQGYRDSGNFIGKRIKSVLRLFLVLIFLPIPLFFIPILWGSRPLSDVLSATKWDAPGLGRHLVGKLLFIPLIIAVLYFSQDLIKLKTTKAWLPAPLVMQTKENSVDTQWQLSKWAQWRMLPQNQFTGLRLKKAMGAEVQLEKRILSGYLGFWHQINGTHLLMSFMQPELKEWLSSPAAPASALAQEQALKLLNATFNLSLKNISEAAQNFGPMLMAPLKARDELLSSLPLLKTSDIMLTIHQGQPHLILEWSEGENNSNFAVAMVPLLTRDGNAYVLSGPTEMREEAIQLVDFFFKNELPTTWDGSYAREAQIFSLIWPNTAAFDQWTPEQIEELSALVRSLGGEALGSESYPFAADFLPFLRSLQKEIGSKIPEFNQFLDKAIQAVEQRDPSFFIGEL